MMFTRRYVTKEALRNCQKMVLNEFYYASESLYVFCAESSSLRAVVLASCSEIHAEAIAVLFLQRKCLAKVKPAKIP